VVVKKVDIIIRHEEPADYREVEELTRNAFWDENVPGCDEHYLVHTMRTAEAFVPELDFVAVQDGKIVGNIMFVRSQVLDAKAIVHPVLTFGPLYVDPERQNQGIGAMLVRHSLPIAKNMGFKAVITYGDPDYYCRFGFRPGREFGIYTSEHTYSPALIVLELQEGALKGITGAFEEGKCYHLDEQKASAFDAGFPHREKGFKDSQLKFQKYLAACEPVSPN
jgi:predicted N-acetyltransferase YhbS